MARKILYNHKRRISKSQPAQIKSVRPGTIVQFGYSGDKVFNYCIENEYEIKNKGKSLMYSNRDKFTHKKMTELLNNIVDKYTDSIPSQVSLNLPKLKKVESSENKELPKIKLPKLKKVTEQE